MVKKLSEKQKKELTKKFVNGESLEELSNQFIFSKSTISRHLKINLGEKEYKEIIIRFKTKRNSFLNGEIESSSETDNNSNKEILNKTVSENLIQGESSEEIGNFSSSSFMEIVPLDYQIQNIERKDLSSVHISEINFPKVVFIIVDKKIELKIKLLKEYPEWHFLPKNDLDRKTIEIYFDLKIARRFCTNEQKVIKVPNTDVFKIVAPLLASRGISRIVSSDNLIAL